MQPELSLTWFILEVVKFGVGMCLALNTKNYVKRTSTWLSDESCTEDQSLR